MAHSLLVQLKLLKHTCTACKKFEAVGKFDVRENEFLKVALCALQENAHNKHMIINKQMIAEVKDLPTEGIEAGAHGLHTQGMMVRSCVRGRRR